MATLGGKLVDEERQARLVAAGGRAMDDTLLGRAIEHRKGALEAGLGVAARLGLADAAQGRANPRLHGEVGPAFLVAGPDALLGGLVMRHQLPPRRDRNRATGAVQTAERPQVSRFPCDRQEALSAGAGGRRPPGNREARLLGMPVGIPPPRLPGGLRPPPRSKWDSSTSAGEAVCPGGVIA